MSCPRSADLEWTSTSLFNVLVCGGEVSDPVNFSLVPLATSHILLKKVPDIPPFVKLGIVLLDVIPSSDSLFGVETSIEVVRLVSRCTPLRAERKRKEAAFCGECGVMVCTEDESEGFLTRG